jgi:hypothetical protein
MRLTTEQAQVLAALQTGHHLKVHRTVDGQKAYRLHRADGSVAGAVSAATVDGLERGGFVESNMKFPAATFLLTEKGGAAAARITGSQQTPAGPRGGG